MKRALFLCLLLLPILAAAEVGSDNIQVVEGDTLPHRSLIHRLRPDSLLERIRQLGFSPTGVLPKRQTDEERWRNIPEDCRIDWHRKRQRPLLDWISDLGAYFNTFDTTYIHRNRYDGMAIANNVNFLQFIRLAGRNEAGERQVLHFAPSHVVKIGPTLGWRWMVLGTTFGIARDRYGSRTSEFNIASYSSRLGIDLNYTRAVGNFNLRSARGFAGIEPDAVAGTRIAGTLSYTLALNLYYVFNYRHFSYPAAFSMSTIQLRSAGSWMAGIRYDRQHLHFDADETQAALQRFSPTARLIDELRVSDVRYRQVGFSLGYAYNWVPRRGWVVSLSGAPSIGYKYQRGERITKETLWRNIENFHMDFIFRGAVAWTSGRYYAGASAVSYFYDYRHDGFEANNSIYYLRFYFGAYFSRKKMYRAERR